MQLEQPLGCVAKGDADVQMADETEKGFAEKCPKPENSVATAARRSGNELQFRRLVAEEACKGLENIFAMLTR